MESKTVIAALAALAQTTRLAIFRTLVEAGPSGLSVGEIAAGLSAAPATLSFHLKELAHAELIVARQESRYIFYSANYGAMNDLIAFLTHNCCARDGALCEAPAVCNSAAAPVSEKPSPRANTGAAQRGRRAS